MFKDGNVPDGLYGEVYRKQTNATDRYVGKPLQELTRWEDEAITATLLNDIKSKYDARYIA